MTQCTNSSCTNEAENPMYKWCAECRRKKREWNQKYIKWMKEEKGLTLCSRCRCLKPDDEYKLCERCKTTCHPIKYKSRRNAAKPAKERHIWGVNLKNEIVAIIDEKAAEKGMSRNALFSWLVDNHLTEVKVW
jgi:hypothetical protein